MIVPSAATDGPTDPAREKHHEPSNSPRSHVAWNRPCGVGRQRARGGSPADCAIPLCDREGRHKTVRAGLGQRKPVVLLSAWTFDASSWGSQIAALDAKGFRCVAPDRRGHGRSEMPSSGYDLDTLTDDVAALIEARDLRDVTLVGFSMGTAEAVTISADTDRTGSQGSYWSRRRRPSWSRPRTIRMRFRRR